jgi:hypothetical protein
MVSETLELLAVRPGGLWVDGTGGVLERRRVPTPMDPKEGLALVRGLWEELGAGDGRAIAGAFHRAPGEGERTPGLQLDAAAGQHADANLGTREVLEHGRGDTELGGHGADPGEHDPMLGGVAVREVEPGDVHPTLDERPQLRRGRGGRTDGADDRGPTLDAGNTHHPWPAR